MTKTRYRFKMLIKHFVESTLTFPCWWMSPLRFPPSLCQDRSLLDAVDRPRHPRPLPWLLGRRPPSLSASSPRGTRDSNEKFETYHVRQSSCLILQSYPVRLLFHLFVHLALAAALGRRPTRFGGRVLGSKRFLHLSQRFCYSSHHCGINVR